MPLNWNFRICPSWTSFSESGALASKLNGKSVVAGALRRDPTAKDLIAVALRDGEFYETGFVVDWAATRAAAVSGGSIEIA